nr:MAG: RNA-dependent RNA polymerase [Wufeng shrew sinhalivirus 1]
MTPRVILPALTAQVPRVVATTRDNMIASLVTRVLNPVTQVNPNWSLMPPSRVVNKRKGGAYILPITRQARLSSVPQQEGLIWPEIRKPKLMLTEQQLSSIVPKTETFAACVNPLTATIPFGPTLWEGLLTVISSALNPKAALHTLAKLWDAELSTLPIRNNIREAIDELTSTFDDWVQELRLRDILILTASTRSRTLKRSSVVTQLESVATLASGRYNISSDTYMEWGTTMTPLRMASRLFVLLVGHLLGHDPIMSPLSFEEWVKRYPSRRADQFREAVLESKRAAEPLPRHCLVKCFLKVEQMVKNTDPRNISPRSDEFLSTLGPFVGQLDHLLRTAPFLVKGSNPEQRARKICAIAGPTYIETDFSRFDRTISQEMMWQVEQEFFSLAYNPTEHPEAYECHAMTFVTKGISSLGVLYNTTGGRCSGDAHTSLFNGLLNGFSMFVGMWPVWGTEHCQDIVEGDDRIMATMYPVEAQHAVADMWSLGFQPKVEVHHSLRDATFCGAFFSNDYNRPVWVPDFMRVLSKIHTICASGRDEHLARAKALSMIHLCPKLPVVTNFAHMVLRNTRELTALEARRARESLLREKGSKLMADIIGNTVSSFGRDLRRTWDRLPKFHLPEAELVAYRTGLTPSVLQEYSHFLDGLTSIPSKLPMITAMDPILDDQYHQLYGDVADQI